MEDQSADGMLDSTLEPQGTAQDYAPSRGFAASLPEEHYQRLDSHVTSATVKAYIRPEDKLVQTIQKKRQEEAERRQRILNAKNRTIGLDKEALDAQCAEKAAMQQAQAHADKRSDLETMKMDRYLKLLDKQRCEEKKQLEQACKDYSMQYLNFASRKEYDLNDPKHLSKARPTRDGDEDPRCGPASIQQFAGEDLTGPERKKQQQLYMQDLIEQQVYEKQMLKAQHAGDDKRFAAEVEQITALRNDMEASEKHLRLELNQARQISNFGKAAENIAAKKDLAMLEQERNQAELMHHFTDPFLNETASHHLDNGKIRRDAFKGADRAGKIEVRKMQQDQAEQMAKAKYFSRAEEVAFQREAEMTRKQLLRAERDKGRMQRVAAMECAKHNLAAREEQYQNQKALKQLYTNEVGDAFFGQFGKSSR